MTHIAIYEQMDGKSAEWMEKVSDEQYLARRVNKRSRKALTKAST
jgi:hypothetical protein